MKLISWNVNGLRAVLRKGNLVELVESERPDVLCLQEIKARPDDVDLPPALADYHAIWNPAERAGYSGTLTLSRREPDDAEIELPLPELRGEGRVVTTRHGGFTLVNVYTPNSGDGLRRLPWRYHEWDPGFRETLQKLDAEHPVVFCGDLNVAHREIDLARPKQNVKNPGFTPEERERFGELLDAGFADSFRHFTPAPGHYSWWSFRAGARARNVGWRIDYFGVSQRLLPAVTRAWILPEVHGSDHCPVALELDPAG